MLPEQRERIQTISHERGMLHQVPFLQRQAYWALSGSVRIAADVTLPQSTRDQAMRRAIRLRDVHFSNDLRARDFVRLARFPNGEPDPAVTPYAEVMLYKLLEPEKKKSKRK